MEAVLEKNKAGVNTRKILIITLVTIIVISLLSTVYFCYRVFSYDRIYTGVYINNHHVGGMLPSEALNMLEKKYQEKADSLSINLKCNGYSEVIRFKDIKVSYNLKETVDRAFEIGRKGNLLERAKSILNAYNNEIHLDLDLSYDQAKLDQKIDKLFKKVHVKVKEPDLIIREASEEVILVTGHHGVSFDRKEAFDKINERIRSLKGGTVSLKVVKTPPTELNVDELFEKIVCEPANPAPVVKDNQVTISPPRKGRSIDKNELRSILARLKGKEDTKQALPVKFTEPGLKVSDIEDKLFRDVLGSSVTSFSVKTEVDRNRAQNIKLSASKIHNYILAPGQVFSFNEVVGERTVEAGYRDAYIFVNGSVVKDVGGGICQVTSTLYYAVLFADLEVIERVNHMFAVSYIPLGIDATVAYGSVDFRFRNNTAWPVRLECVVTADNKLHVKILGTNETPGKSVSVTTKLVRTIPYTETKINDPNLPAGKTVVVQEGSQGYVVDTYKTIKIDGKVVSEKKLHTSTYTPLNRTVRVGTKQG